MERELEQHDIKRDNCWAQSTDLIDSRMADTYSDHVDSITAIVGEQTGIAAELTIVVVKGHTDRRTWQFDHHKKIFLKT